jgi:hypothetical protein
MTSETDESLPDFETVQGALFEATGLEYESWFIELDRPSVRTHVFRTGDLDSEHPPLVFLHGTAAFGPDTGFTPGRGS